MVSFDGPEDFELLKNCEYPQDHCHCVVDGVCDFTSEAATFLVVFYGNISAKSLAWVTKLEIKPIYKGEDTAGLLRAPVRFVT